MTLACGGKRLAVECDGDRYHTIDDLPQDMARQAILERLVEALLKDIHPDHASM